MSCLAHWVWELTPKALRAVRGQNLRRLIPTVTQCARFDGKLDWFRQSVPS